MFDDYARFELRLDRTNFVVIGLAVIVVATLDSLGGAASVGAGGLISWVNFRWLKRAVNFVVSEGGSGPVGGRIMFQYAGRYALIGLGLFVTIRFAVLDVTLFLAGLFSYVLAVLLECILEIGGSMLRTGLNGRT